MKTLVFVVVNSNPASDLGRAFSASGKYRCTGAYASAKRAMPLIATAPARSGRHRRQGESVDRARVRPPPGGPSPGQADPGVRSAGPVPGCVLGSDPSGRRVAGAARRRLRMRKGPRTGFCAEDVFFPGTSPRRSSPEVAPHADRGLRPSLTERQRAILDCIGQGLPDKAVARAVGRFPVRGFLAPEDGFRQAGRQLPERRAQHLVPTSGVADGRAAALSQALTDAAPAPAVLLRPGRQDGTSHRRSPNGTRRSPG